MCECVCVTVCVCVSVCECVCMSVCVCVCVCVCPDLLATASFDGTLKIWNVNNMSCVNVCVSVCECVCVCVSRPGQCNLVTSGTCVVCGVCVCV